MAACRLDCSSASPPSGWDSGGAPVDASIFQERKETTWAERTLPTVANQLREWGYTFQRSIHVVEHLQKDKHVEKIKGIMTEENSHLTLCKAPADSNLSTRLAASANATFSHHN
eukprot:990384-Pelagomonas_calceolata.AAC.3